MNKQTKILMIALIAGVVALVILARTSPTDKAKLFTYKYTV